MTFEDAYGKWLVGEINTRTQAAYKLTCKQYNELSFKPLANNPDEIAVIVSGGGAARSSVSGQDQNSGTFSIMVLCQKKHMEKVRDAINYVQKRYNAVPIQGMSYKTVEGDSVKESFLSVKSVFFTPLVMDAQDLPTQDFGTLKTVFIQFTVTVLYGTTAVVAPTSYELEIDEKIYPVQHVASCDHASIPAYDSYLAQGESKNKQIAVSKNNSLAITVYKTSAEDELQAIFEREVYSQEDGLWGRPIALIKDNNRIPIQAYQLSESYVDNAAAFVLTLMV